MKRQESLYETDYALWLDRTIADLKERKLDSIDWENLIEEVESLGRTEKRELRSRLITLFEHILKRCYTSYTQDYRGWQGTITRERRDLKELLIQSPSLKTYWQEIVLLCYSEAVKCLKDDRDYDQFNFPLECPFPTDPDRLLNDTFWE